MEDLLHKPTHFCVLLQRLAVCLLAPACWCSAVLVGACRAGSTIMTRIEASIHTPYRCRHADIMGDMYVATFDAQEAHGRLHLVSS